MYFCPTTNCRQLPISEQSSKNVIIAFLSPVYICYLDASKAFDRLNYWCLFNKLLNRNFPKTVVKLLIFWYTTQSMCVQWNSCISASFLVSNGVRQGGNTVTHLI